MSTPRRRLLITGGSGLLALNWARAMSDEWAVLLALHKRKVAPSFAETTTIDLHSARSIADILDAEAPALVVHAAGMTNVDDCEANPEAARLANVEAPANLAAACHEREIRLASISTDHLFSRGTPLLDEEASSEPLNIYGRTKADGEKAVLEAHPAALVARTNFFCWGPTYRPSFSDWIVSSLRRGKRLRLFTDVFFTPILADHLARAVHELTETDASGRYNVVSDERLSKHDFGLKIADIFGLDASLIDAARLDDHESAATRPHEMSLSNRKLVEKLGRSIGDVNSQLQLLAEQESWPDIKEVQSL